eukprot:11145838-Prorocentrum_lima.AAC.1
MTSSLVGSEMCIRDRLKTPGASADTFWVLCTMCGSAGQAFASGTWTASQQKQALGPCLRNVFRLAAAQ